MAATPLVEGQIEDGRILLEQLISDGFEVSDAFWIRFKDEEEPTRFYVVSKSVDENGFRATYEKLHPSLIRASAQRGPYLLLSDELVLVGVNDPNAKEVAALRDRYPKRSRFREANLGSSRFAELYIYSVPRPLEDERWRGIFVGVYPTSEPDGGYCVEFWPTELAGIIDPSGLPRRVRRPAGVRVNGGHVTEYRPPEEPQAQLKREDYEQKALEAVEQVAGKRN
jgi:hypothetical protein